MATITEPAVDHPLEPLTGVEIETAVDVLEAEYDIANGAVYHTVVLDEPSKSVVDDFETGDAFDREAFIVFRRDGDTYEATVSVTRMRSCWKSSTSRASSQR